MRRMGGLIFWMALLAMGALGTAVLAVDRHPLWAGLLGSWIACAAAVSVALVVAEREAPPQQQQTVVTAMPSHPQLENASTV